MLDDHLLIMMANQEIRLRQLTGATLALDIETILGMIGYVQLGLRHPEASQTATAELMRAFLNSLIAQLSPDGGPLHDLLMRGFDPESDVFIGGPTST